MIVPVTVRSERLGLLEVVLPARPDDAALEVLRQVGAIVAYVIVTVRRYTDLFERVRRRRSLELAAEIQWGCSRCSRTRAKRSGSRVR